MDKAQEPLYIAIRVDEDDAQEGDYDDDTRLNRELFDRTEAQGANRDNGV